VTDRIIANEYFIQSRPAQSQPWRQASGPKANWSTKTGALAALAYRRENQPNWEHRLMARTTIVTEQPADEETGR
jgi:hypothetical protein